MSTTTLDPANAGKSQIDIETLCGIYCPPLEAGLVYALASDFDLNDPASRTELQNTLNELKQSAIVEQDLELLPPTENEDKSQTKLLSPDAHQRPLTSNTGSSQTSRSGPTDDDGVTSITTGFSGLKSSDLDDNEFGHGFGYGDAGVDFEKLSEDEKCQWLGNMFPNVTNEDIKKVLVKCNANFDRSTDELLNLTFLKESNEDHSNQDFDIPRGIEGFLQPTNAQLRPKSKGKSRRKKNNSDSRDLNDAWASDSAISSGVATPNVWKNLPEDVEFIASRTYLRIKPKTITSVYHANGARLPPTIRALVMKEGEAYTKSPNKVNEIIEWQMDELRSEFSQVPDAQIYGALMLTNGMPSAAKDLLDTMVTSNEKPVFLGKISGLASYTPIDLSEDDTKPRKTLSALYPSVVPASSGVYTTTHLANHQGVAATQAFQQASAAYRRGKSDHLMGGAAAYYASVGHERIQAAKSVQAAAADAHVAAQSSSTSIDLHGVNVSDAVRIAQRGTEAWWEGLGDRKYVVGGKGNGYRIVTGVGKHSSDGIGRIGPAVSKMLVREGWRVEVGRGEIIVSGKARR